jgi:hypothetical protein
MSHQCMASGSFLLWNLELDWPGFMGSLQTKSSLVPASPGKASQLPNPHFLFLLHSRLWSNVGSKLSGLTLEPGQSVSSYLPRGLVWYWPQEEVYEDKEKNKQSSEKNQRPGTELFLGQACWLRVHFCPPA